jgi:hypothetical protein
LVKRGCVIKCFARFSEAIRNGSFSVDDIRISNGTINAGSFTKISDTQYTIVVTPSLGGQHSNVAIANVLVKRGCVIKCFARITYMGYIPTR